MKSTRYFIGLCVLACSLPGWAAGARDQQPGDFVLPELAAGVVAELAVMRTIDTIAVAWPEAFAPLQPLALLAIPVGPAAGVAIIGSIYGVEGNLVFALLGSTAGCLAAFPLVFGPWESEPLAIITALSLPPLGATLGYNWNAAMKEKSANAIPLHFKLSLPLFDVQF